MCVELLRNKVTIQQSYLLHTDISSMSELVPNYVSQIFAIRWCTCILWSYLPDLGSTITHIHTHDRVRVKPLRSRVRVDRVVDVVTSWSEAYSYTKPISSIGKSATKISNDLHKYTMPYNPCKIKTVAHNTMENNLLFFFVYLDYY
jgi:hypothetical protein